MGYILPVIPYDYKQYQNRMKETKESPYYIGNIYKTVFHGIHAEYDENTFKGDYLKNTDERADHPHLGNQRQFYLISKRQKAELTGKGGMINEKI